jgi:hypothetical protein
MEVETNYYSKDPNNHHQAKTIPLPFSTTSGLHTYALEWTPTFIAWSIDGKVVRVAHPEDSPGIWPQSPMQIHVGLWAGGGSAFDGSPGTQEWAGGRVDWGAAPFSGVFQSVKVTDYGGGYAGATEYVYSDRSGTWQSIKAVGGTKRDMPGAPGGQIAIVPPVATGNGPSLSVASSSSTSEAPKTTGAPPKQQQPGTVTANSTSVVHPTGTLPPNKTSPPTGPTGSQTAGAGKSAVSIAGAALMIMAYFV